MKKKRNLQIQQEQLDDNYRRELQQVDDLIEDISHERRKNDFDMDELYSRHQYFIKNIDEENNSNSSLIRHLEESKFEFEDQLKSLQMNVEDYMEYYEVSYRKQQRSINDKLMGN